MFGAEDQANEAGEQQERVSSLSFTRETMIPFITKYTKTGSLYYTDD